MRDQMRKRVRPGAVVATLDHSASCAARWRIDGLVASQTERRGIEWICDEVEAAGHCDAQWWDGYFSLEKRLRWTRESASK